eukprot:g6540.t1
MFPEDYNLPSGRAVKSIMDSPTPDLSSDGGSPRETPEALSPDQDLNFTGVTYIKWILPRGTESNNNEASNITTEGGRSVKQAVCFEIPPDPETLSLKKSLSSKTRTRRRSSHQSTSFDYTSRVDRGGGGGGCTNPNPNIETKNKWQRINSLPCRKPSTDAAKLPEIHDRNEKSLLASKWHPHPNNPTPKSDSVNESSNKEDAVLKMFKGIETVKKSGQKTSEFDSHKDGRRIPDIEKIVGKQHSSEKSSSSALHLNGGDSKPPRGIVHSPDNERRAGFTISPLPTAEQLKTARAVHNGCRTDSESACSGSGLNSGYSDSMLTCSTSVIDSWTRKASMNPCSDFDEVPSRFAWLRKSVVPLTALAGFILVSVASISSRVLRC